MRRFILWEKWVRPLGGGEEFMSQEALDKLDDEEGDLIEAQWDKEGYKEAEDFDIRPVVPAAMGYIPISIYGDWPANFNFRVAHTSFTLSRSVRKALKAVPGVETLDIMTRYRCRIGIGKCFEADKVEEAIEEALQAPKPLPGEVNPGHLYLTPGLRRSIRDAIDAARQGHTHWSVYLVPNGRLDVAGFTDEEERRFEQALDLHRQALETVGGVLFTSDETNQ
jgi:hypothetical protein